MDIHMWKYNSSNIPNCWYQIQTKWMNFNETAKAFLLKVREQYKIK